MLDWARKSLDSGGEYKETDSSGQEVKKGVERLKNDLGKIPDLEEVTRQIPELQPTFETII